MSTAQFTLVVFADGSAPEPLEKDISTFLKKFSIPYETLWLPASAQNLRDFLKICDQAQGDYIVTLNARLSSPLGDLFKLLQSLTTQPELDLVFGERISKARHIPRWEKMFLQILQEKKSAFLKDPFSDYLALRKSTLPRLESLSSIKSPFITAQLQKAALQKNLKFEQASLHETDQLKVFSRYSFFQMLFFSLRN